MKLYTSQTLTLPLRQSENGPARDCRVLVLRHNTGSPAVTHETAQERSIGVLWLHGGGYELGSSRLIYMSSGLELVRHYNVTLFVPDYALSGKAPYPAALWQAYDTLLYMKIHSRELDIRKNQLMAGGESSGGGLCCALCMLARDKGEVHIAYQMPLYPMIDDRDTETSQNNSGVFWNTRRNHKAWRRYLRNLYPPKVTQAQIRQLDIPPYAAPARQTDYHALPPCYSFVAKGEPFYAETVTYIENLKKSRVHAHLDEYEIDEHGFDMTLPMLGVSKKARERFVRQFAYAMTHFSARNG